MSRRTSSRVGRAVPACSAAATGASGCGYRANPASSVTPESRATSARSSSPESVPVCTGLHTATSMPA